MKTSKKIKYLIFGLIFDGIGMLSFTVPGIGEFTDVIWAPVAAWLMTRMYKGRIGQIAGMVTFIEELVPGLDVVPGFTLMWIYTFLLSGASAKKAIKP
jgi:hypothetical protein